VTGRFRCIAVVQIAGSDDCYGPQSCHPVREREWQLMFGFVLWPRAAPNVEE
jgi:hypothetical protein